MFMVCCFSPLAVFILYICKIGTGLLRYFIHSRDFAAMAILYAWAPRNTKLIARRGGEVVEWVKRDVKEDMLTQDSGTSRITARSSSECSDAATTQFNAKIDGEFIHHVLSCALSAA